MHTVVHGTEVVGSRRRSCRSPRVFSRRIRVWLNIDQNVDATGGVRGVEKRINVIGLEVAGFSRIISETACARIFGWSLTSERSNKCIQYSREMKGKEERLQRGAILTINKRWNDLTHIAIPLYTSPCILDSRKLSGWWQASMKADNLTIPTLYIG